MLVTTCLVPHYFAQYVVQRGESAVDTSVLGFWRGRNVNLTLPPPPPPRLHPPLPPPPNRRNNPES